MAVDTAIRIHINKTSARELYLQGRSTHLLLLKSATGYVVAGKSDSDVVLFE